MKTSMLMKIVAALAIGAAFPLGASAAQPAKTTTEHGAIQNVKAPEVKAPEVKARRQARENITSRSLGWIAEADGDLQVERFDAVCRERQAG